MRCIVQEEEKGGGKAQMPAPALQTKDADQSEALSTMTRLPEVAETTLTGGEHVFIYFIIPPFCLLGQIPFSDNTYIISWLYSFLSAPL